MLILIDSKQLFSFVNMYLFSELTFWVSEIDSGSILSAMDNVSSGKLGSK